VLVAHRSALRLCAMDESRHSEHWLTDTRDNWWNDDYLELIVRRLDLANACTILDVGSGKGHWGQRLLPMMSTDAQLSGLDPDPAWNKAARERAADLGLSERATYQQGRAESLPFDDASFDLVTCQTLLIHLADPAVAVSEMI